ncbi:MAG TPA: BTAD domain-containing putative transcriptional regulator [Candidatus Limnocylindrales bacterium]|nr:BTAD domain-containing putative transcriptional regulator [Candidatus Limnocylindrales bacterium]
MSMPSRSAHLSDEGIAYPIQVAKVQRPALRDETLERTRLLDWLRAKIHGRVVLLLADAGYGKTTLLADFARRTRMRTLWYRLDHDDRDWVTLLQHLIAAGREYDPGFAPATSELLSEIGVGGPTREAALDTFIGELPSIATGGAVLIFDDFHLVDDAPDARFVARELVARAPERLTVVFASRRAPTVPLSRLRSVGEVAELGTDDLRFDATETARLFTETYGRRLDADVLEDLAIRTEGWIASLQLVQAALRDRSPTEIRHFVRSLNGADRDLYDYLAEEVVGDLPDELQRFLMDTSILQVVTPELAEVVSGREPADVARLTAAAERLTLLSRLSGGPRTHQRYHPLVREFLEGRFKALDGADAVAALHRRTAAATAATDWRIGAHHYREAGDTEAMLGVVATAIPDIMGNGQYALAEAFIGPISADDRPAGFDLILSRVDMQQGDYEAAIAASQSVLDSGVEDPVQRDHALLNLVTLHFNSGNGERALEFATALIASTMSADLRAIGEVTVAILRANSAADLDSINRRLRAMASAQKATSSHHYGVSMLNLALNSLVQDRISDAWTEVGEALRAFESSSGFVERTAANVLAMSILLRRGNTGAASELAGQLTSENATFVPVEALADAADAFDSFGSSMIARSMLDQVAGPSAHTVADQRILSLTHSRMAVRRRDPDRASAFLETYPPGLSTVIGASAAVAMTDAHIALLRDERDGLQKLQLATGIARAQGATAVRRVGELLMATVEGGQSLADSIAIIGSAAPWHLAFLAEDLLPHLPALRDDTLTIVRESVLRHPERWRTAIRRHLETSGDPVNVPAARFLEEIGEKADVAKLRRLARSAKRRPDAADLGRALSRRLADRVRVEDQGRVALLIGARELAGSTVRRKVLGLLCFLITRPDMSATRDQVLEALWPELDPEVAVNSLNQTIYFLRRVFEEEYSDDLSPGYLYHSSDVVWLDPELVTSRSIDCRQFIRGLSGQPSPDEVDHLSRLYRGRFALEFEYEEWAAAYRDSLHAAYLEIVERSVLDDFRSGHYDRGITVARRALDLDPTAEQIEVCLLRLYRVTGAHAAAAEQYGHYATMMRDELGLEPIPLDSL